jgi:hypothetical protein
MSVNAGGVLCACERWFAILPEVVAGFLIQMAAKSLELLGGQVLGLAIDEVGEEVSYVVVQQD